MNRLKRSYPKVHKASFQGFTFAEVLAGIAIATIFTLLAAQSVLMSTLIKAKTRRTNEANNYIQADLEFIRFLATSANPNNINSTLLAICDAGKTQAFIQAFDSQLAPTEPQITLLNKPYTVTRSSSFPDWNVLRLDYQVSDGEKNIASLMAEVTPEISHLCSD